MTVVYYYQDATNATFSSTLYYLYKVKVDQFSSLKLAGLTTALRTNTAINATLQVQFQNQNDKNSIYTILDTKNNRKRSFMSIVINTDTGTFTSIDEDNFCDSSCG